MLSIYLSLETGVIISSYTLFCNCPRYTGGLLGESLLCSQHVKAVDLRENCREW